MAERYEPAVSTCVPDLAERAGGGTDGEQVHGHVDEQPHGHVVEQADDPRETRVKFSVVVLTMGNRPEDLERAVRSVLDQENVDIEVVLVGNGVDPVAQAPAGSPLRDPRVNPVYLPYNTGVPAGRNRGVEAAVGEIVMFLDDDGWYPSKRICAYLRDRFDADEDLGIISLRVQDPEGGPGERRHVPRLRAGDPGRSSVVTTFLGGASAIRRTVYDAAGGLPERFFYAHEETDLAWQALDAGYRIEYDATAVMYHPAVLPTRHTSFYRYNARNRVWLARRNLPWPIAIVYLVVWTVITVLRERKPARLRPWFGGFAEGWRKPAGRRRPISYRTAWRMTLSGRPPII